jgi:WD40 repeat protein
MVTVATYDLFVSYADADRAWVEGYLLDALTTAGVRCHSEAAFALGAPRVIEFERAVKHSRRSLLVLSPAYLADDFAQFANLLAQSYGLESGTWPVIPLLLDQTMALPERLAMLEALDASDPKRWPQVVDRLCAELDRPPPGPAPLPPCPYPGLAPFRVRDAPRFYGRDAEIRQMGEHLRHHRLLFVVGPSGSGKSSLISAGLLPALERGHTFPRGYWVVRGIRPSNQTLRNFTALTPADPARPQQVIARLLADRPQAQCALLVIDQFEELFTQFDRAEQIRYIATLNALRAVDRCALLVAMRADFFPDLMNSDLWPIEPSQRLELAPLRGAALRRAIEQPAADLGVYLDARLTERLIADAADEPGALPLVQEAMVLLWAQMARRLVPLGAYEQLGSGGRSGLAVAIATRADATLAALTTEQQATARRILLRLVQFGEGRADTRRQQPLDALRSATDEPAAFERALRQLVGQRLLTLSSAASDSRAPGAKGHTLVGATTQTVLVDIAHEALIAGWPTLRAWLDARRESEQTRRRLEQHAAEWARMGRAGGGLLDTVELLEAERWLEGAEATDLGYSPDLRALVQASRAAIDAAEHEREAARRRELEALQALGQEHAQRLADQSRSTTRLRWLAATLALLALGALGIAWYALAQAHLASSRQLAVQAAATLNDRFDLALLLGLEAYRASPTREARNSLIAAREHSPYLTTFLRAHTDPVESVAFSPDGRLLASGSCAPHQGSMQCAHGEIRLWDVAARRPIEPPLHAHTDRVFSVAFSPDGHILASGSCGRLDNNDHCQGGQIQLWDVATRQALGPPLAGHTNVVTSVAFSPDGRLLASGSWDNTIMFWDIATRRAIDAPLAGHTNVVTSVAFSPDGRLLASGSQDKTVILWDVATRRATDTLRDGHINSIRAVAFSPNGTLLATGSVDSTIRLWDVATRKPIGEPLREHSSAVVSMAWSADGQLLASGGLDKRIILWDAATHRQIGPALTGHTDTVTSVSFSPDGTTLASGSEDAMVILWDLRARPLTGRGGSVESVAFSPDSSLLAAGGGRGQITLWHSGSQQVIALPPTTSGKPIKSVAFSPDGRLLASGGSDGAVILWDLARRQPLATLGIVRANVESVAFNRSGTLLASGGGDGQVILWDIASRQQLGQPLAGHTAGVESVAFDHDGTLLATGGDDGQVILWDVASHSEIANLTNSTNKIYSVTFSPNNEMLAAGGAGQEISLWNVATRQPLGQPLRGHSGSVYSLAFNVDGTALASGGADKAILLWDVAAHQRIGEPLIGHRSSVFGVAFSPDGQWLASGSGDGTFIPWNVGALATNDFAGWQTQVCTTVARNFSDAEWQLYGNDILLDRTLCPSAT